MISESQTEANPGSQVAEGAGGWLTFRELLLLLILASVQFTHIVDFTIMMPLGPVFSREMGLSPQQFGAVVAAYTISAGIAGVLLARFLDRFDRKTALLGLYTGFIVGTLLCGVAPDFPLLLAARTVAGAFGGVVTSVVFAIVGDAFPDARRGMAMGVVMSAFAVATFAGVPLGLLVEETSGNWRSIFIVLGGVSAGVLVLAIAALPRLRGHLDRTQTRIGNAWAVLTDPNHVRAFALTSVLTLSSFMVGPFLATFLEFNVGVERSDLKYVYVCGGLATLATMTVFGRLADRFGKLLVFRILALFTVLPILTVSNLPHGLALPLVLAVTTVFILSTSGRWVPAMALVAGSSAPAYRGTFMSFNSALQNVAAGVATSVAGLLLKEGDNHLLTGFPLVGLLTCVATIASVLLAGRLQKDPGGDLAPDSEAVAAVPAAMEEVC